MRKRYQLMATGLLALGLCASNAMAAGASDFTGFKLGATAGWQDTKVDYSGGLLDGRSQSDGGAVAGLNAAYGFALGSDGVVTIGATYDLNSTDFGIMSYSSGAYTMSGKIKNHASLYVAPGLRLNSDWLAYAKVAYHRAKSEYVDSATSAGTKKHNGFGYGLGVAYALSKNVELNAEVNYVKLSKEGVGASQGEPILTSVTFGANYRFD